MYHVEYSNNALKQLKKLDKNVSAMLYAWIEKNLVGCDNPKQKGKGLVGNHSGEWRYRVGDYRLIVDISEEKLVILMLSIAHRCSIYKE